MPNYFSFTRKGETKPTTFDKIDEELCALMGQPVHPTKFLYGWYDFFGEAVAVGMKLDDPRFDKWLEGNPERLKIRDYLRDNFTTNAWYQPH